MPGCSCLARLLDDERFGPLRLVGMLAPRVDLQMTKLFCPQAIMGEHPAYRPADDLFGPPIEKTAERFRAQAARMAAVAVVDLALALVAADRDARGVDDDDVVAGVEIGLVGRLVLALEDGRDARGETPERLAGGIDHVPASLDLVRPRRECLRRRPRSPSSRLSFRRPGPETTLRRAR